jgi:hypothetical protein
MDGSIIGLKGLFISDLLLVQVPTIKRNIEVIKYYSSFENKELLQIVMNVRHIRAIG